MLFVGNPQGRLEALDQKTGRKLWGFKTGSGIVTNPMSFAVDGRQYVAISSGWSIVPSKAIAGAKLLDTPGQKTVLGSAMLFVFALPEAQRVSEQNRPAQATPIPVQLGQLNRVNHDEHTPNTPRARARRHRGPGGGGGARNRRRTGP